MKTTKDNRTRLCAYDNGFGLVISNFIGDRVSALERMPGDKFRVTPPLSGSPTWDQEWEEQKDLVNDMVDAYNEKYGLSEDKTICERCGVRKITEIGAHGNGYCEACYKKLTSEGV